MYNLFQEKGETVFTTFLRLMDILILFCILVNGHKLPDNYKIEYLIHFSEFRS